MTSFGVAELSAAAVLAAGCLGLGLQRVLPESFTTGPARDMLSAVAGLLTLLCALVLGLLIWTAYGVYAGQNGAMQQLAGKALQLDLALADYGPETSPIRERVKHSVAGTIAELDGARMSNDKFVAESLRSALRNLAARDKALEGLKPQTDEQKHALSEATATVAAIAQTRLQMALALANPVSYPLLVVVTGWASAIFLGYGLTSKAHLMTFLAVALGGAAIASAFFLIVDLSSPYSGVFRVSPAPLEDVLSIMGQNQAPS